MSTGLRYKILVAENFFRNSDVELASWSSRFKTRHAAAPGHIITEAMYDDDDERAQIMMCRESWLAYKKKL
jgi:hypothetical protein